MKFEMHGNQIRLDGRKIGWITHLANGDKVYISPRKRKKHFHRNLQGWGLAVSVLEFLKANGFKYVQIRIGERETLTSEIEDWQERGVPVRWEPFEKQMILPEKYMVKRVLTLSQVME